MVFVVGASSDARDDNDVEEGDDRGLSIGEMFADEDGVDSVVAKRRRADPEATPVLVIVYVLRYEDLCDGVCVG